MGAQLTIPNLGSSKDGNIYINLEKKTYSIGETITGLVCLNLNNYLGPTTLFLKLKGRENVNISTTITTTTQVNNQPRQQITYKLDKEKNKIVDVNFAMQSWNSINPGQYGIPFSFLVPHSLPGSFYTRGRGFQADISYFISAELRFADPNHEKLKFTEKVNIKALVQRPYGTRTKEASVNVKTCCSNKGTVHLCGSLEKDILTGGETTLLISDINNEQSGLNINSVNCSLIQIINLKAHNKSLKREIPGFNLSGELIPRGQNSQQHFKIIIPPCQDGDVHEFKKKDEYSIAHTLSSARFPSDTTILTTKSKLIQTSHFLRVTCQMENCCSTTPLIDIPVEIVSEEMRDNFVSAPPQWHPQMFETVNIVASPNFNENYSASTLTSSMNVENMSSYQTFDHKKNQ